MLERISKRGKVESLSDYFKKCTAEMVTLFLLDQNKSMYVYELEKEIKHATKGVLRINTLYPTIYRLLKLGYILEDSYYVTGSRVRRYYSITEAGKERLDQIRQEYHQLTQAVHDIMTDQNTTTGGRLHNDESGTFEGS